MSLALKIAQVSHLYPDQEAIIYHDQRLTYNQMQNQISRLSNGLRKLGITPGERVLIALGNCPEFIISYFAILQAEGIVVPVNPQLTRKEFDFITKDASPVMVITDSSIAPVFKEIKTKTNIPEKIVIIRSPVAEQEFFSFQEIIQNSEAPAELPENHGKDDVAAILYTHGTTGAPKGAMLTNDNLCSNATAFAKLFRLNRKDRSLLVAPAYHSAAQTCVMNASLVSGATLIVHDGWNGPEAVLTSIQDEKVTFFLGPPPMYSLLTHYPQLKRFDTSSWRIAYSSAAPLSPEVFQEFHAKFGFQISEGYGMTETSSVVCVNSAHGFKKPGSVGFPVPGIEVKIVDYEDKEVPAGEIGEIVVRGPNVMKGYHNREEETNWVMRNGWFHTNDLAYMDPDGQIYIIDRKKDLIIRGGLNVHPREVEDVLYTHPKVFDVAVVGVPDPLWGEEVMAIVLLRAGEKMEPRELQDYCVDKLARYKIPRYILFVEEMPKTSSGKLLKYEIKHLMEKA